MMMMMMMMVMMLRNENNFRLCALPIIVAAVNFYEQ
jgi:hypothetical protein